MHRPSRSALRFATVMLLCFCTCTHLGAQDVDSLRKVWLDPQQPDSVRFTACFDLAWEGYLFSEPDSSYALAEALIAQAHERGATAFEARGHELLAATWYVRGDLRRALTEYAIALPFHEQAADSGGVADVLTNMAGMRSYLGENDEALRMYARGLRMHEALGDSTSIANDLNAIGRVHMVRGDHARAVGHYARSLRLQELRNNDRGAITGLMNMGSLNILQADYEEARVYFEKALVLAEKINDRHQAGTILMELGTCAEELGDPSMATRYFERSLAEHQAIDDQRGIVKAMNKIGDMQRAEGSHTIAVDTYSRSVAIGKQNESPFGTATGLVGMGHSLLALGRSRDALSRAEEAGLLAHETEDLSLERDVAELRFLVLKALGRGAEALGAHERFVMLRDSMMKEENQREVLRFGFQYAYEKQALADSLAHQAEQYDTELRHANTMAQERSRRNLILAGLVLVVVIAFGIWARMRYMARANRAIMAAQVQLLESERQREAEKVRTRIASDIHDDLGSDLTKLGLLGREIKRAAAEHAASTMALAERIVGLSADATAALGDIVWAADPLQDSAQGLVDRASIFVHRLLEDIGIEHRLEFVHNGEDRMLDPGTKHDIFMLLKELINNALKHSGASRIEASLITDAQRFRIRVHDNGKGFDIAGTRKGNGLRSIEARSARIGASVDPDSAPGDWCTVTIEGPLDRPDNPLTN